MKRKYPLTLCNTLRNNLTEEEINEWKKIQSIINDNEKMTFDGFEKKLNKINLIIKPLLENINNYEYDGYDIITKRLLKTDSENALMIGEQTGLFWNDCSKKLLLMIEESNLGL